MDGFEVRRLQGWMAEGMDGCVNGSLWGSEGFGTGVLCESMALGFESCVVGRLRGCMAERIDGCVN